MLIVKQNLIKKVVLDLLNYGCDHKIPQILVIGGCVTVLFYVEKSLSLFSRYRNYGFALQE